MYQMETSKAAHYSVFTTRAKSLESLNSQGK